MSTDRSATWRYGVCGMLLLATMLLYMDRLTLSQLATTICNEYSLTNQQYGLLDTGFSYALASGAFFFGFLVDRLGPRLLYPLVVIGWSCAGLACAYAETIGAWLVPNSDAFILTIFGASPAGLLSDQAYYGFMICRIALGFFEAGHWPCALVTTQIILSRGDRSLGNSILQSGAAIGSIVTPIVVLAMLTDQPGSWRGPFVAVGCIGMMWAIPWLILIRRGDLDRTATVQNVFGSPLPAPTLSPRDLWRMFGVLIVIVITINLTWQFYRNWLPKYLEETHHYTKPEVGWFTSAYYVSTDVGCIVVGFLVKWLIARGWDVHSARLATFAGCAGLALLAVAVVFMPTGPLLLIVLLFVAAGTLGLFPNYYSFSQELTRVHQGKISGALSTIAWVGTGTMQWLVGKNIDATKSYATGIIMAGLVPLLAVAALCLFWPRSASRPAVSATQPLPPPSPPSESTAIKELPNQIRKF